MDKGNARRVLCLGLIVLSWPIGAADRLAAQSTASRVSPHVAATQTKNGTTSSSASAQEALPAWDVSTIKPRASDARGSMLMFTPDGVKVTNVSLFFVAREAFGLEDDRIFNSSWGGSASTT
jgi:hypothetical protein